MSSFFLMNMLTFMSGMLPVLGVLISRLDVKRKIWIVPVEIALLGLAAFLMSGFSFAAPGVANPVLYSFALSIYPISMAIMLPVLCLKYSFARALALTLMLGFLLTELQEIVGFGRMYLGLWDNVLARRDYWVWFTPLNHVYSVFVACLALWISGVSRAWIVLVVFPSFLFGVLCELAIYPQLGYGTYDLWNLARRVVWLPILLLWMWNPLTRRDK